MRIIDAFWDTRSLGVETVEIEFDNEDGNADLEEALSSINNYRYIVAKVASGNIEILSRLQENGFRFIECSIEVSIDLRSFTLPLLAQRFDKFITVQKADDVSKQRIYEEIRKGIFDTDRISLDSAFSTEIAAQRYVNWIEDELNRGGSLYHVKYKNEDVGFFSYKETEPGIEAFPFLAALYENFKTSGLGMNVVVGTPAIFAQNQGCRRIRTYVSSNNLSALRIHELLGYTVTGLRYVLTKHVMG